MQKNSTTIVSDRGFIQISGPQAEKFLQGQVTCDVRAAKDKGSIIGAHCNPKGRILFTFRLFLRALSPTPLPQSPPPRGGEGNALEQDAFLLCLPKSQVEYAIAALKKYAVFSKVTVEDVSEQVHSSDFLSPDWKVTDIESGIAEIHPETREQFTPHEINYHELGGVSFDKGCYTGQEIVARMHYLGKLKTKLVLLQQTELPQRGEKILSQEGEPIGQIVDFAEKNEGEYLVLAIKKVDLTKK